MWLCGPEMLVFHGIIGAVDMFIFIPIPVIIIVRTLGFFIPKIIIHFSFHQGELLEYPKCLLLSGC